MRLLFQSDDFGITYGVTDGIVHGIKNGIIKNTGLFINMESSKYASEFIKEFPDVCFGLDVNLVSGKPISDPNLIPNLVRSDGYFRRSTEILKNNKVMSGDGVFTTFEVDPFPLDETMIEVENQIKEFLKLTGKYPEYIHGHSLITENIIKTLKAMSKKYNIKLSFEILKRNEFNFIKSDWNKKPFYLEEQMKTDVETLALNAFEQILKHKNNAFICHCGFVDDEIFKHSTYTIIRTKDLVMATSDKIKEFIKNNNIELITYRDIE